MKFTDEVFHHTMNQRNLRKQAIDELVAKYQPKILEKRTENGYTYTRYESAHADGCGCHQYIKGTSRSGDYDL